MKAGGEGGTEDEMVGCYHRHNRHEFEQTPGDSEGQGSLVCYSPRGHKELDMPELQNNKNNNLTNIKRHDGPENWPQNGERVTCSLREGATVQPPAGAACIMLEVPILCLSHTPVHKPKEMHPREFTSTLQKLGHLGPASTGGWRETEQLMTG